MSLKCPNCGGQVAYEPGQAKVICRFCLAEMDSDDFSKLSGRVEYDKENIDLMSAIPGRMWGWDKESEPTPVAELTQNIDEYIEANLYHCKSCGAELMINGTEATTFCSYCGSSEIVFERVSKEVRPRWIIPFKLTQEEALSAIKERFSQGSYIHSKIKELTVDNVHAIYMPYWLFDIYIRRKMIVEASTRDDGTFLYEREASCHYKNVTADASMKLNNEMSRRLEPFYTDEMVEFDIAYLSGFYADRYDVPKEAVEATCVQRCRNYLDDSILGSCRHVDAMSFGGMTNYEKKDVREYYEIENVQYALFPAYFVNLKYDKGRELVIVNGQTGKVVGNLPYDKKQLVKKFIKNSLIACLIYGILAYVILRFDLYPFFFLFFVVTGLMVSGGISGYNKYKMGKYRMAAANMISYVNDREDFI